MRHQTAGVENAGLENAGNDGTPHIAYVYLVLQEASVE